MQGRAPAENFFYLELTFVSFSNLINVLFNMARYEHLPIYKAAFDFNVYVEQIVRHFSRYHKYTPGTELRARNRSHAPPFPKGGPGGIFTAAGENLP